MKVVILAGGMGTRIREEQKPKPLVEIGGKPILWHVLKIFSVQGFNDFIICLGYKNCLIKKYFLNEFQNKKEFNVEISKRKIIISKKYSRFTIVLVDTGVETNTGERLRKIRKLLNNERFILSYADDLKNINLRKLVNFHIKQKSIVTLTGMNYHERFGILTVNQNKVKNMIEKPRSKNWINGGYYVIEPEAFEYIEKNGSFEDKSLRSLIRVDKVAIFRYTGKYIPMDTLNDKMRLEKLWRKKMAYWKIW